MMWLHCFYMKLFAVFFDDIMLDTTRLYSAMNSLTNV